MKIRGSLRLQNIQTELLHVKQLIKQLIRDLEDTKWYQGYNLNKPIELELFGS